MQAAHAAMKKDLDVIEQRLTNYCPKDKFIELKNQCMDFAERSDVKKVESEVGKIMTQRLPKLALKVDVKERFEKQERELWEELSLKMEKKVFERKFTHFELESDNKDKLVKKELLSLREVLDQMRKKTQDVNVQIRELTSELETKMTNKEGLKLWANFRKYAQYDELRDLYRKTLPAISSFEDKLKQNNDHNERIDETCRRMDEVICNKADRTALKEFREYCTDNYISKNANDKTQTMIETRITDFGERCAEMESMTKFQAKQLQKEMYSAVRRTMNQAQQKEENQPVSMATVVDHVKKVVSDKADRSVMDNVVMEKANKVDTEMCLRWVDLLHKMVNKVVLLLTTKLKVDLDMGNETNANVRQNKKVQLLQQGLIISKWIESFDSQNINDFYFMTEKEKQPSRIN